ncbi:MAG: citrate synthase [Gammaproteobacteria bacterium]|nr:citrate synthase [Gammaproteobacteria bacterium]MBU1654645.1 citrate synthase [Gammaproteobacteria bacterium]MBU1960438.1 citrate synthase [Gammaproteobacteria bacterium]
MSQIATLILDGESHDFPVIVGTENEPAIDISSLRARTGHITLDQGYGNTGSCESAITYIDGEKGILRYRGIPIEQFANGPNFIEVAWLLIFGRLPNVEEYAEFANELTHEANIDEGMRHHFDSFPRKAPPMAILASMVSALSCFHPELLELDDPSRFRSAAARLMSKIRTIAAFAYRHSQGLPYMYPDPREKYVNNFLHMMFSMPYDHYVDDDLVRDALNMILILHADHEQNCSTSTVRMVGSSHANLFASCSAGISALWGPLHGGANVAVLEMLQRIHDGQLTPQEYVKLSKDKESGVRLMGFGHRVYKNFDPRARLLADIAGELLPRLDKNDPLLNIARELEEIALQDPYFVERKLYPNVDFYSGIILRAIGIPVNMFTVIFAMGRLPGWIAHWWEQQQENARISRPRQVYQGNGLTDYTPLHGRKR